MARRPSITLESLKADKASPVPKSPSRTTGTRRGQTLRLDVKTWKRLKTLAVAEETTSHALLLEALDMLFKNRVARQTD